MWHNSTIISQKSTVHWLGVFAQSEIKQWETIEICPIILLNQEDTETIDQTHLYNYYFSWEYQWSALALGYGSLYNHSYSPNARYQKDFANQTIHFLAIQDINRGEEITVNYNGDPLDQEKVWFDKDSEESVKNFTDI